jgi:SSS family solute:Na+ symporter
MPLYQFLLMFVFIIGFVAVLKLPGLDKTQSDLVLLKLVKQTFSPWIVGIIGAAGVLTALVPGSIILLSLATLLVKNILSPFISLSAKNEFLLVRSSVPIIMLVALVAYSYGGQTIVSLLIVGYGLVSQLFPAMIFSFLKRNPINKYGSIAGMLSGTVFMLISILIPTDINRMLPSSLNGMNNGIIALIINITVMFIVSVIFTNRSNLRQNDILQKNCY